MDRNQTPSPSNQPQSKRNRSQIDTSSPPPSLFVRPSVIRPFTHIPPTPSEMSGIPPLFPINNIPDELFSPASRYMSQTTNYDPNILQYGQFLQSSQGQFSSSSSQQNPFLSSPSQNQQFEQHFQQQQFQQEQQEQQQPQQQQQPPNRPLEEGEQLPDPSDEWMTPEEMGANTRRKSTIWNDMVLNKDTSNLKAKCNICNGIYSAKTSGGTGHLIRHVRKCKANNPDKSQPHIDQFIQRANQPPFNYSIEEDRHGLARMVIQTEQSFLWAEGKPFNKYVSSIQPEHKTTGRKTVKKDAVFQYVQRKAMLISQFKNMDYKVNITSDCWDSGYGCHYLCVTVHWVDDEWTMQKRIIGFQPMEFPHNATNIANIIMLSIAEYDLKDKILSCTFDNASAMTLTVFYLKNQLGDQLLGGKLLHVRCACHILNLCVRDGQKGLLVYHEMFKKIVKTINLNKPKRQEWRNHCHNMGVAYRKFPLDCETRWNSTYEMLQTCLSYKDVLTPFWNDKFPNETPLTEEIWSKMSMYVEFLVLFYNCTKTFSHVYTPIASSFMLNIFLISQLFKKYRDNDDYNEFLPNMETKFKKYWEEIPLIYIFASILDPRIKFENMVLFATQYWSNMNIAYNEEEFKNVAYEDFMSVYDIYERRYGRQTRPPPTVRYDAGSSSSSYGGTNVFASAFSALSQSAIPARSSSDISELQMYLKYEFFKNMTPEEHGNLDILQWWKAQRKQFPILAAMARDIFSVQVSSVASERAFSASGRVLDDKRTRMNSATLEMCVCYKDWLDADDRNQDNVQWEVDSNDSGYASSTQTNTQQE